MFLSKIRFARNYYMELVSIEETIIEMDSDITIVFEVMKKLIPMFGKKDLLEIEKVEKKYLSISKFKQDRQILFLIIEYYEKYKFIENKNRLLMSIINVNHSNL